MMDTCCTREVRGHAKAVCQTRQDEDSRSDSDCDIMIRRAVHNRKKDNLQQQD